MDSPTEDNVTFYFKEADRAMTYWKPRQNRNVKFLEKLAANPKWLELDDEDNFKVAAEDVRDGCSDIVCPTVRHINKERRLYLLQSRQRAIAAALRKD